MILLYLLLFVILPLFIILFFIRSSIIRRVQQMTRKEKLRILTNISEPLGYLYDRTEDIFTTTLDAWQKDYGYTSLYDEMAPLFGMVFDREPVYFNYDGRTWLIQFWKGQYGINTGGEIGIYQAKNIIDESDLPKTTFYAVSPRDQPEIRMRLYDNDETLFINQGRHWWLTGFCVGYFEQPANLRMAINITFRNSELLHAFMASLLDLGYCRSDLCVWKKSISFGFKTPKTPRPALVKNWYIVLIQAKNRLYCRVYRMITCPFKDTLDQLIYLYFCLPFVLRRIIGMKGRKKCLKRSKKLNGY